MSPMPGCPFCAIDPVRVLRETETVIAFFDAFPVSEGHVLVIPRRHVSTIYKLADTEQTALWAAVGEARAILIERYGVDCFNIGVNDGLSAGQTISHAHIHIIPRRPGDVDDPRGGIRWILADKAAYWK